MRRTLRHAGAWTAGPTGPAVPRVRTNGHSTRGRMHGQLPLADCGDNMPVQDALQAIRQTVDAAPTRLAGVLVAHKALTDWLGATAELSRLRTAAIREAVQDGYTYSEVGEVLGISRQRARQIGEVPGAPGRRPVSVDHTDEVRRLVQQREGET